ncbi:MAG: NusG domain II-containing protein [Lachnospiraceae bacterium]|nr:NusG domain II-containing protein [Lachnospiraceae bacterium]
MNNDHSLRRADIILIAGCLLAALLLGILFVLQRRTGSMVRISCDGAEVYIIDLTDIDYNSQEKYYMIYYTGEDRGYIANTAGNTVYTDQDIYILYYEDYPVLPEAESYNLISVIDDKVTMEAADCRDQICVNHKPIMAERESIICLPHKLVIEIEGNGKKSGSDRKQKQNADTGDELLDGVTR